METLESKIPICETFFGTQGEGTNIGRPQFFIRAATCDMKCAICDSKYSWKAKESQMLSIREIVDQCCLQDCKSICLTGGEIALFPEELLLLVHELKYRNFHLVLQTNGKHYHKELFRKIDTVSMDIKTPITKEQSDINLIYLLDPRKDEIKTLIANEDDYEFSLKINKIASMQGITQILQSCNLIGIDDYNSLIEKYKWINEKVLSDPRWDMSVLRILPQLHVLAYGNVRKK